MPLSDSPTAPPAGVASQAGLPAAARRGALAVGALGLALVVVAYVTGGPVRSAAAAAGYKDHAYTAAGPQNRGTADKPQSKLWYTDGSWFGAFVSSSGSDWEIHRLNAGAQTWTDLNVFIEEDNSRQGDYLWVESQQKLYAVSTLAEDGAPMTNDLLFDRFGYDAATDTYTRQAGPVVVADIVATDLGPETATIARDSTGKLWVSYPGTGVDAGKVMLVTSTDDGATWGTPFQLPVQGELTGTDEINAVVAFGSGAGASIGVMWNDSGGTQGMFFAAHLDTDVEGTWGSKETAVGGAEMGDDHINLKVAADGRIFAAAKTHFDGNPDTTLPQALLLERSTGGDWSKHVVSTVAEDETRPQVLISDELGAVWVYLAQPTAGGSIFVKSASYADLAADNGAGTLAFKAGLGAVLINNAPTDANINDPTTTKQNPTAATEMLVAASDRITKTYFHGWIPIAATDAAAPTGGSVTIAGGAAATAATAVTLAVPAADAGSGVSQVQIWNAGADGTATCATKSGTKTLAYNASQAWTLPAGDGTKRVCVRWRDTVGNWTADGGSALSDTIVLDTTAPSISGVATPAANAAGWRNTNVTVTFTCGDVGGSGIASCTAPALVTTEGTNGEATGTAIDNAGNSAQTTLSGIKIDKTAPTASATVTPPVAGGWNTSPVTVTISGSDALSGLATRHYRVDGGAPQEGTSVEVTGHGSHSVGYWAVDAAGNASVEQTVEFDIDATGPTGGAVSIAGGAAATKSTTVSVLATASDPDSGLATLQLSNSPTMAGAQSFAYTGGTVSWTIPAGDGTKTVYARFVDAVGNVSGIVNDTIVLDTTAPQTTILTGPAALTKSASASLTFSASETATFSCSLDGSAYTTCASPKSYSGLTEGTHVFRVRARDTAGNLDATAASRTWKVDLTAPTATAPTSSLTKGSRLGTSTVPIRLAWSGADAFTGVASYQLQQRTDASTTWVAVTLPTPTATSLTRSLAPGHSYRFRVRAIDKAGNASAWATAATFRVGLAQQTAATKTGTWTTVSSASASGGSYIYATAAGASFTYTFNGRAVAWVAPKTPLSGSAKVYVDGTLVTTVDLYSATTVTRALVYTRAWSTVGSHTIKVVVVGTAGHPRVGLDAFVRLY